MVKRREKAKRLTRLTGLKTLPITEDDAPRLAGILQQQHWVQLRLRWTPQKLLVVQLLQVRAAPDNLWKNVLEDGRPVADNDGDLLLDLGRYSKGEIGVRFVIRAMVKVPKAVTYLAEDETRVSAFRPEAGADPKTIEPGVPWEETGLYTVGLGA